MTKTNKPQNATAWLQVRVKPADKKAWTAAAKRADQSLSEWATEALNDCAEAAAAGKILVPTRLLTSEY
jgi:predicted HicB family RNase H-like nuclease